MRQLLAVAETEALRIVRRRETFFVFLAAGLVAFLPFVLFRRFQTGMSDWIDLPLRIVIELVRNLLLVAEAVGLAAYTYLLAHGSLAGEEEKRTLPLLVLGPIRFRIVILGKALAVLFVSFCLHGFVATALAAPRTILRGSFSDWLFGFLCVFVLAASFVPDALIDARMRGSTARRYVLFRTSSLLRVGVAGWILVLFLRPEVREQKFGFFDLALHAWNTSVRKETLPVSALFESPRLAVVLSLLWLAGSGILGAVWFLRRGAR